MSQDAVQGEAHTRLLLDRPPPAGYRREWTQRVAAREPEATGQWQSGVIFRVGAEWFGLPTTVFREAVQHCPGHALPHRDPATLHGLATVRGELLLCVSLAGLLGVQLERMPRREALRIVYPLLLVVQLKGGHIAFPVDEIHGVLRFDLEKLRPVPATLAVSRRAYTQGLLPWKEGNIGWLDEELLFYSMEKGLS